MWPPTQPLTLERPRSNLKRPGATFFGRPALRFSTAVHNHMLDLRPYCECCDKDLPPDSADARICSFECTFCSSLRGANIARSMPELGRESS